MITQRETVPTGIFSVAIHCTYFLNSLYLGHQNRKNVHSPTTTYTASMSDPRSIQNFAMWLFTGMNMNEMVERVWRLTFNVTTKAEIHKVYAIVLSVLA